MTLPLDHADFDKLEKLAGMLASPADAERAMAALKTSQLLEGRGVRWNEVIGVVRDVTLCPVAVDPVRVHPTRDHQRKAMRCLGANRIWNDKERDFLVQMSRQLRAPTERQAAWLNDLDRLCGGGREWAA